MFCGRLLQQRHSDNRTEGPKRSQECVNGIAISSEASDMKPRRPARGFELAKRRRNAMLQQGL